MRLETMLLVSVVLLWLVVLGNVLLTLALVRRTNAQTPKTQGPKSGALAPDFSVSMLSGETATLATYTRRGKHIALLFISVHCRPCRAVLEALKGQEKAAQRNGIELVLVSGDEREETSALLEEMHLGFPTLIAPRRNHSFFADYNISATPSYCFLNEEGKVQSAGVASATHGAWKALTETWTPAAVLQ